MISGLELGHLAVSVAEEELRSGAREIGGNNAGPYVQKYMRGAEGKWCAGFFSWCWEVALERAGDTSPIKYSGSVSMIWGQMRLLEQAHLGLGSGFEPAPGDAVFWDWDQNHNPDHINMVHHLEGRTLYTIGGNENSGQPGSPVRIKCWGEIEKLEKIYGIGRMWRPEPTTTGGTTP